MEEQQTSFNVTTEGSALLAAILELASESVVPGQDWESGPVDLPPEVQETVLFTAGAILVQILQQCAEAEDDD